MDRENEGDFIMEADLCTPQAMAIIIRYSSGVICIAMEGSRMDELGLPPMVTNNEDPKGTAFSISVDATREHGTSPMIGWSEHWNLYTRTNIHVRLFFVSLLKEDLNLNLE
jgi:low affinity Fe/Cu permease